MSPPRRRQDSWDFLSDGKASHIFQTQTKVTKPRLESSIGLHPEVDIVQEERATWLEFRLAKADTMLVEEKYLMYGIDAGLTMIFASEAGRCRYIDVL